MMIANKRKRFLMDKSKLLLAVVVLFFIYMNSVLAKESTLE